MQRVDELPNVVERQKEGHFRLLLIVPYGFLADTGLVSLAVDLHLALPRNVIYATSTGDYTGRMGSDVMDPDKYHGVVELEVRRKTVEELENDG